MGKQQQSRNKYSRGRVDNSNPYNKLDLNKYHQIGSKTNHTNQSKLLHKRIRDIERVIKHKQQLGQQVDEVKAAELKNMRESLGDKKKKNQKNMRRQFFIKSKYKQIMEIQMRKVVKRLRKLKQMEANQENKKQMAEWEKKLRYIKFFPKNLKYVSLFPNSKPLDEEAIKFQQKVMNGIEQTNSKKTQKMNMYVSENKQKSKRSEKRSENKMKQDQFFMEEEEEEQN